MGVGMQILFECTVEDGEVRVTLKEPALNILVSVESAVATAVELLKAVKRARDWDTEAEAIFRWMLLVLEEIVNDNRLEGGDIRWNCNEKTSTNSLKLFKRWSKLLKNWRKPLED